MRDDLGFGRVSIWGMAAAAAALVLGGQAEAEEPAVVRRFVRPGLMQGWRLYRSPRRGDEFARIDSEAPRESDESPGDRGSLHLSTGIRDGGWMAFACTRRFNGKRLSSLTELSYFSRSVRSDVGPHLPYLVISVRLPASPEQPRRSDQLVFIPSYQPGFGQLELNRWIHWRGVTSEGSEKWWSVYHVAGFGEAHYGTLSEYAQAVRRGRREARIAGICVGLGLSYQDNLAEGFVDDLRISSGEVTRGAVYHFNFEPR